MLKKHKTSILAVLTVIGAIYIYISATSQAAFAPGTELDPNCEPGDPGCVVTAGGSGWGLDGNSGTDDTTNFLGTTDDEALVFKVNNTFSGKIYSNLVFFGSSAGTANTTGINNTAIGSNALSVNSAGYQNTAIGANAMAFHEGNQNTIVGSNALANSTDGNDNVAFGRGALNQMLSGSGNTAIGTWSLRNSSVTDGNTAIGFEAGYNAIAGNVFIGYQAGKTNGTGSNQLWIDNTDDATPLIFGDFSTGEVGIGTTSPSSLFHVLKDQDAFTTLTLENPNAGTGAASDLRLVSDVASAELFVPSSTYADANYAGKSTLQSFASDLMLSTNDSAYDILFSPNVTEALRIKGDTGFVGIGTASPNSLLQVGEVDDATKQYIQVDSETSTPTSGDCNEASEAGRMYVRSDSLELVVCFGTNGWSSVAFP